MKYCELRHKIIEIMRKQMHGASTDDQRLHIRKTCPCNVYPLESKTWVYRSIPLFLIFALKHKLWVLVRTASAKIQNENL